MKPIAIDFAPRPRAFRPTLWLLVIAGAICSLAILHYLQIRDQAAEAKARLAAEYRLIEAESRQQAAASLLSPERVASVNEAIMRLNTPWELLLDGVERSLSDDVALLSINPESARRHLNRIAETKDPAAMIAFVGRLSETELFSDVLLQRHRIEDGSAGRPYRFAVEAQWGDR
jgi:hypothetical protein